MNIDWSKSHCGVMLCTFDKTIELMPEVIPVLQTVPKLEYHMDDYLIDVKVHMLMPGEYPCITNWHQDFVPRDKDLKKLRDKITGDKMYLWVSGPPLTEFSTIVGASNEGWTTFTQNDVHRGTISKIHTWRCFIRLIPKWFVHPTTINVGQLRRHSQVYIEDPNNFRW